VRWVAIVWLVCHGAIAPALRPANAWAVRAAGEKVDAATDAVEMGADRAVVWINAPEQLLFATNRLVRARLDGRPRPPSLRLLVSGPVDVSVVREDAATLRVDVPGGLFRGGLGALFLDPRRDWREGERIALPEFELSIAAVGDDGHPTALRVHAEPELESVTADWWYWDAGEFRPFDFPEVGETLEIAAPRDVFDYRLYRAMARGDEG
jgi:hypothetical protein